MNDLSTIEIQTNENPNYSVIWLHGLGADGNDFAPIIPELKLPTHLGVRFIFPNAPSIPVTINGGMVMPAWYDILEMSIDRKINFSQLEDSTKAIQKIITTEIEKGIASENIAIAGFSQGGAVAAATALTFDQPLAGLLAMSTYVTTETHLKLHQANSNIPIAIHHGKFDPVVPFQLGESSHRMLNEAGYDVIFKSYPMEHAVCIEQIADISAWLQSVLK